MEALTDRQQAILDFLGARLAAEGLPPSLSEIALAFGIHLNAVRKHLQALADKGAIALLPGKARGIRLLQSRPEAAAVRRKPLAQRSALKRSAQRLPLVGRVAAGAPILSEGHIEAHYWVDPALFRPRADFLLRVEGDSMIDAGIHDGDLIVVLRTPSAEHGQIVVARIEGEITVKRLYRQGDVLRLLPANPAYQPIELSGDAGDFAIEGIYVGAIRRG